MGVINSTTAVALSSQPSATKSLKPQNNYINNHFHTPKITILIISNTTSSSPSTSNRNPRNNSINDGEVLQEYSSGDQRPEKITRFSLSDSTSPPDFLVVVKYMQRTPTTSSSYCSDYQNQSPVICSSDCSVMRDSPSGRFPTITLFKEYKNAAMAVSTYCNHLPPISEGVGFLMDGDKRREKRFMKPNHDVPSTTETKAKNKAWEVKILHFVINIFLILVSLKKIWFMFAGFVRYWRVSTWCQWSEIK